MRDVATAYEALITHGQPGHAYNVGAGQSHEIRHLLDQLVSYSTVPIQVEVDPARLRPVDVPDVVCDNRLLTQHTGWRPQIPVTQTMHDILAYWRHIIKESKA